MATHGRPFTGIVGGMNLDIMVNSPLKTILFSYLASEGKGV
jgi:hypothetical protein